MNGFRPEHDLPVSVFADERALASAVADRICAWIARRSAEGRTFVLGLATGRSPRALYAELRRRREEEGLSFEDVWTFNLDEYYPMLAEAEQSFHSQIAPVLSAFGVAQDRAFIPPGDVPRDEIADVCREYEARIREAGGIDFQILGIGRTGHIGFNEPGSEPGDRTRLVSLDELTRQDLASDFGGLERVPREAITMGIGTILEAKEIGLIAAGKSKASIVKRLFEEPARAALPASFLKLHAAARIYLDAEAASEVDGLDEILGTGKPAAPR